MAEQCGFFEWADANSTPAPIPEDTAPTNADPSKRMFFNPKPASSDPSASRNNWPITVRPSTSSSSGANPNSAQSRQFQTNGTDRPESGVKRQRTSTPVKFVISLEDADNVSTVLRPSSSPDVKEAVKKFSATAVGPTKTAYGEEKVLIPVEKVFQFETYIKAQVGGTLTYEVPRMIIDRLCNYQMQERKRETDGDVITRSLEEILPTKLCESLMQFQWYGVNYALKRGGRCLIGDDMGLGKTIQAIAIARVYVADWPLLIVCPSSLRLNWREELLRWLADDLHDEDIRVVMKGKDIDKALLRVNIISYDLVRKVPMQFLRRCQCVIADESHYLKSGAAQRTKAVTPLLKRAKRALLLSGTPALSRPVELFAQINAVSPLLFPSYNEYAERYCNARQTYWGYDVSGSSHLDELHTIMRGTLLLRRKKEEVLTQLPEKVRHVMWVETKPGLMKRIGRKFQEFEVAKAAVDDASTPEESNALRMRVKGIQNELYSLSADAKIDSVLEFCKDTAESGCKFIVFAHHATVVEKLDDYVRNKLKLGLIRIDGRTPQADRQDLCKKFQADDDKYRVAVLSITAAGVGLTLTKATVVLFAELYWNPGTLLQAEDRAHRIGQRNSIFVNYLLAKKTLDESMWKSVCRKLTIVGQSLTGTAGKMEVEEGRKDALGGPMGTRDKKDIRNFFGKKKEATGKSTVKDDEIEQVEEVEEANVATATVAGNSSDIEETAQDAPPARGKKKNDECGEKSIVLDDLEDMFPDDFQGTRLQSCSTDGTIGRAPGSNNAASGGLSEASGHIDADLALAQKLQAQFDAENEG